MSRQGQNIGSKEIQQNPMSRHGQNNGGEKSRPFSVTQCGQPQHQNRINCQGVKILLNI
jgi:hypothetical protein